MSDGTLHMFNQRQEEDRESRRYDWEKQIDEAYVKGALATNFEERKKYYDEYQRIAYDQKPFIYIYSPIIITAIRTKFKNVFPSALAGITYNLEEIYIDNDKDNNTKNRKK